ncbi:MAG: hypothetical protein RIB55_13090 [Nitratireductor sp.]
MLERRIPVQLGGMTDPFSPWEERQQTTLKLLQILADHDYPTLISTKGTLISEPNYRAVLRKGNFYVRFSFTAADPLLAARLEPGVPSRERRLQAMATLAGDGASLGVRFQPLILGHEDPAVQLLPEIKAAGAKHVAVEYLKWPMEQSQHHSVLLSRHLPGHLDSYIGLGARRVGREYVLPAELKVGRLSYLKRCAEELGLLFGYAENDLLHLNGFNSCCNAADLFLRDAHFFDDNILARLKTASTRKSFDSVRPDVWRPKHDLLVYMNSHSRNSEGPPNTNAWLSYLAAKWAAPPWRGGPSSFYGLRETEERDAGGLSIFEASTDIPQDVATRSILFAETEEPADL